MEYHFCIMIKAFPSPAMVGCTILRHDPKEEKEIMHLTLVRLDGDEDLDSGLLRAEFEKACYLNKKLHFAIPWLSDDAGVYTRNFERLSNGEIAAASMELKGILDARLPALKAAHGEPVPQP